MEQFERLSNKFANMLKNLGVQRGDAVFAFVKAQRELEIACFGAMRFGVYFGAIPPMTTADKVEKTLFKTEARLLLVDSELKPLIDQMRKRLPELWHVVVCNVPQGAMPPMGAGDFIFEDYYNPAPEIFYDPRYDKR